MKGDDGITSPRNRYGLSFIPRNFLSVSYRGFMSSRRDTTVCVVHGTGQRTRRDPSPRTSSTQTFTGWTTVRNPSSPWMRDSYLRTTTGDP